MIHKLPLIFLLALNMFSKNDLVSQSKTFIEPLKTDVPVLKQSHYSKWSLKAGANISVIYLVRNTKENDNQPGYCGGITYEVNNFVRVSALYTHFKLLDIKPTWLNIKANTYEMNMELLAYFPNPKTLLYPFLGLSYNTYNGFFTGQSDYLNLKEYYPVNSKVKNRWVGLNLGTGLEHQFGILGLFIDYRMRIGKQEKAFNIMDVCYTGGIKIKFPCKQFKMTSYQNARYLD